MVRKQASSESHPGQPLTVMVLEDEPNWSAAVCTVVRRNLTSRDPAAFPGVAQALAYLRDHEVDLIFLDLNVDDSQGFETLACIREAAPLSAIVVMTGADDEGMALEALGQGAQDYLVKGQVDSKLLWSTARFAVERMRAVFDLHQSEQTLGLVLDALPACIALLDETGRILLHNQAWLRYANPANPLIHGCTVGTPYLAVCDHLADPGCTVHAVARGVLQVLAGLEPAFVLDYAIPEGDGIRWYELHVTRISTARGAQVVMAHQECGWKGREGLVIARQGE